MFKFIRSSINISTEMEKTDFSVVIDDLSKDSAERFLLWWNGHRCFLDG